MWVVWMLIVQLAWLAESAENAPYPLCGIFSSEIDLEEEFSEVSRLLAVDSEFRFLSGSRRLGPLPGALQALRRRPPNATPKSPAAPAMSARPPTSAAVRFRRCRAAAEEFEAKGAEDSRASCGGSEAKEI